MKIAPRVVLLGAGTRGRIGIAFLMLALASFALIATLSGIAARRASERASAALLRQVTTYMGRQLDADMTERYHEIERLSSVESALDLQMTPAHWRDAVERLQASMKYYSWIGVTDAGGVVLASTQGLLEGKDVRERPWFRLGQQHPVVLDVHEAKLLGQLLPPGLSGEPQRFVDVAAPLRHDGRMVGVIAAHLSWDWAEERRREVMSTVDPALGIELTLVDRSGAVVLGPPLGSNGVAGGVGRRYLTAVRSSEANGDYPGMGWTVVARQPVGVAFAEAEQLQQHLWAFGVAGALLFGIVGWWLAGRLTQPLRDVARRARAVTQASSHDEVEQLAASLSSLIDGLRLRELELETLNANLERLVRERTASYEQANEDLRSFSRSVSHDLRGPLGQMGVLLQSVTKREDHGLSSDARAKLEVVAAECERLRELSTELLTLAMVQQSELVATRVDSRALVDDVLHALASDPMTPRAEIDVGDLPPIVGDPTLLRQVWANLLSNAVKYSSKVAQPRIRIGALRTDTEVIFSVEDNGAGFEPSRASRLFGVFQRLHGADEFPGVGVGLSIVKRVVQRHGGRVWAESTPGRGATFQFSLPIARLQSAVEPFEASLETAA